MNFITLLLLLLFSFVSFFSPSLSQSQICNSQDKQTLLAIKKALNNRALLSSSWQLNTDCCSWKGVECSSASNHRVTSLTISSAKLSAQFPPQIGDLVFLRSLELSSLSNLYGPIPPAITKLKNLQILRLTRTSLSGSLPDFLSELKSLTFLDISYNNLTGPIPKSLSRMPNLEAIQLIGNQLTGSIPESFGSFVGNLPNLYLAHNRLSGTIPASFAKLDFNAVDLSSNQFTGDASMLFGTNKTTVRIDVSSNMFKFDLSKVKFSTSLYSIGLSHNRITGKIPDGLTELAKLQFFDISHNQIVGNIPTGLNALQNLKLFDISHNRVTGNIPREVAALRKLERFDVSYNKLCGQIPAGGNLQTFNSSSYTRNLCLCGAPLAACKGKTM